MNIVRRSLLTLLVGLGVVRALFYFAYAAAILPSPLESFHLEAKMVLLAYRAEQGISLYPGWVDYPHVTNFYGPIYFESVGLIGRVFGADIPGLFGIGRALSFGSGLLTSLVVGVVGARSYGRTAGVAGAILSLGGAPMIGFSVMVRPDLLAEFLGVLGFFLAGGPTSASRIVGVVVLVLAALTKQTMVIFLVAAAPAWVFEGAWRRGLRLWLGGTIALVGVVGAVTLLVEPNFAGSLLGDSKTPLDFGTLAENLKRICLLAPDLLYFPVLGLIFWASARGGERNPRLAVLASLVLISSVGLSAKRGADLNYYLSLRVVEGLAVGALWRSWSTSTSRPRLMGLTAAAVLGCLAILPGADQLLTESQIERSKARFFEGPDGQEVRGFYRTLCAMAADPRSRLLTDSGLIDLYQGDRAAFGDPFLFRIMTETGQVNPTLMRDRIDSGYYDLIVTTSPIDHPSYDSYAFGLPKALAQRVKARYVQVDYRGGLFLYRRRPGSPPSPG